MEWTELEREQLQDTFLAESEEQLGAMEQALVALELQPDDEAALQQIFRAAHTLKGNAASMGYAAVAELAHAVEGLLDLLRSQAIVASSAVVTLLLRALDAIRRSFSEAGAEATDTQPADAALIAELCALGSDASVQRPLAAYAGDAVEAQDPPRRGAPSLRVDTLRLDRMLDLSGEMAVARGRVGRLLESVEPEAREALLAAHHEAERICLDLQQEILRARMVPIGPVFRQQARTLRDAAAACGKLARLEISGEDVELDTAVVEQLGGSLTHMVRNALDHGIEKPARRIECGKDPRGTIALRARHEAGGVVIELVDDGAGLDRARIAARARQRGLAADPETLPDAELLAMIFEPGFSTAESVTELSGRGVGMDVVRRNVLAVRGSVEASSQPGAGTTIAIRVPLTVAIIQGFLVDAGGETYVIPLDAVMECADLPQSEVGRRDASGTVDLHGQVVPYLRLREVFGLTGGSDSRESLVVVQHQAGRAALAVDGLLGEAQAVIKPLGGMLQDVAGIAGSTILGNGRAALILDVPSLLRAARSEAAARA